MTDPAPAPSRIIVVEDEYLIRMMLEDMLTDLGHTIAGAVGTLAEATELARTADFDLAILDVNLEGQHIFPVADILTERGLPYVFVSGGGENSLPEPYRSRPSLQKPFHGAALEAMLSELLATA